MPSRLASGANTLQRFARHAGRRDGLARRVPAQRLQARRQAQHHHAQVARERQQHLAHVLGLHLGVVHQLARVLGLARLLLDAHQLGGFHGQRGVVLAERLGDDLLRLVQVRAGVDQVAGRLHRFGAAHGLEDGGHRVGVGQRVLAGVQRLARDERLGKRARPRQRIGLVRHRLFGGGDQLGDGRGFRLLRCQAFHRRIVPAGTRPRPRPGCPRSRSAHVRHLRIRPGGPCGPRRVMASAVVARQQVRLRRRA